MPAQVALFIPCFVDQLGPQVGLDMARVLRRIGCTVEYRPEQTCCGQPAFNTGYWQDARPVAERFVRVFSSAEAVVCPSASCASMVRKFYPELLAASPLRDEAMRLGQRIFEFAEYLVRVAQVEDVGAKFPHRVTFHDSCHALRELGLKSEARALLRRVQGLELVEMAHPDECCGFGGTFAMKFAMISAAMGDSKVGNIETSGAEFVTAPDPSCLMHIEGVLRRRNSNLRAIALPSILAQEAR